jgi:transcriptional regulator with XRE-family HTH domain
MNKTIYSKEHKYLVARLKKARIESGLNQKEAAKLLRKSQPYVSKIESGQRRIDIVQVKEFAKIYKKDLDFFIKY